MLNKFKLLFNYINFWGETVFAYPNYSNFVQEFILNVIDYKIDRTKLEKLSKIRSQLEQNEAIIEITDLGAGSQKIKYNKRQISKIAKYSGTNRKQCEFLFKMVRHYKPTRILELGTSLGFGTITMALANPDAQIITIEGCPNLASIAKSNFETCGFQNIQQFIGSFDECLPLANNHQFKANFIFFDGNHRKIPTLKYFEYCLQFAQENTIFVFDDIHWSGEMYEAWQIISENTQVTVTIDLFHKGLAFFSKNNSKENTNIRM